MPRIAGSGQALRIPTNRETNEPYAFISQMHWSEWIDTPVRQYVTIWSIPLSAFGLEIQLPEGVTVPLCKAANRPEYYLVTFDPDYLKERFYREWVQPLCWSPSTVQQFFDINQQWISDRIDYFKKNELREQAAQMSSVDPKRRGVEFWFQQLVALDEEENKANEVNELTLEEKYEYKGTLEKLSNEYFLRTKESFRYKVMPGQLKGYVLPNGILEDLVGCKFYFNHDPEKTPPKSRNAKGWVLKLTIEE